MFLVLLSSKTVLLVEGSLKLEFESFIETDYEEKWEHKPIWKFLRGVSDRFFTEKRRGDITSRMTTDLVEIEWSIMSSLEIIFKNINHIIVKIPFWPIPTF